MRCVCFFDPRRDIAAVDSTGFLDLQKAFVSGSVPAEVSITETAFNNIDDPSRIGLRPSDNFEILQAGKVAHDYVPPKSE